MAETLQTNSTPGSATGVIPEAVIEGVQVELEAFIGSTRLSIAELKRLKKADILSLDAPLNQSVELRLNGLAIARGEVVAVGDNFGIRLTEVVS